MKRLLLLSISLFFMASLSLAQSNPWGSGGDVEEKPPVDYLISSYQTTGAIQNEVAKLKFSIQIMVFAQGWIEIPLFPSKYSLTSFVQKKADPKESDLILTRDKEGKYNLLCGKPGSYAGEIELVSKVAQTGFQSRLSIPFISAVSGSTSLSFPTEISELESDPQVQIEKTTIQGKSQVVLYGSGGATETTLSWKETPKMELVKPLLFAEQNIDVYIGRGLVRSNAKIGYTILQGAIQNFKLYYPTDCNLMEIKGEGIKNWNTISESGKQCISVDLLKPAKETYILELSLERPTGQIPGQCEVPTVTPDEVKQERGLINVYSMKALKVEPGQVSGATQVDVHDTKIPEETIKDGQYRLGLAYKYLTRPFSVQVQLSPIEPKVTVTTESLVSASRDSLRANHWIDYDIKDAGVFRFKFKIDEESKLLDIKGENINNWRVKNDIVEVDLRSMAQGSYTLLVEVEKSIQGKKKVVLPSIVLYEVTRQTGYVAVSPRLDTKVEAVPDEQVTQIDVKELPDRLKSTPEGVSLAYRYLKLPFNIPITVGSIEPEVDAEVYLSFTIKEKELYLDASINYDIRKAGIFELRIHFPSELRLVDTVYGNLIDDWRVDKDNNLLIVSFRSKVDGKYSLKLSATTPIEDIKKGIKLPVLHPIDVKKDRGYASVQVDTSVRVKTSSSKEVAEIDVNELPAYFKALGGKISLAYKYFRQPWSVDLAIEPIESVVTAEMFTLAAIGDGLEQISSRVDYDIQYAGVSEFSVNFPQGTRNVNITGDSIKHRGPSEKDPNLWTVSLQSKIQNKYTLYLTFERKMEKTSGTVDYPGVKTEGIEREVGFVAIAPRGNVELNPIESGIKGIHVIDASEIPEKFKKGLTIPIIWAFKYITHPYNIKIESTKHEDVEALVAIADYGKLTTVVSQDGETMTDFTLILKNNRKQFLRMVLPAEAEILDAFVGGRPVRLGQETIKDRDDVKRKVTMIPISGVAAPGKSFPIKLIYETKTNKLKYMSPLSLDCPDIDIPVLRLGWELRLPPEYELSLNYGDLNRVYELYTLDQQINNEQDIYINDLSERTRKAGEEQVDNKIQFNLEVQQLQQRKQAFSGTDSAVSPRLMSVLVNGRVFLFEKILSSPSRKEKGEGFITPGLLRLYFLKQSMEKVLFWLFIIAFIFAGWYSRKASNLVKFKIPIAGALILMAIYTLKQDFFPELVEASISMLWLIFAVFVLELGGSKAYQYLKARRALKKAALPPAVQKPVEEPVKKLEEPQKAEESSKEETVKKVNRSGPPFYHKSQEAEQKETPKKPEEKEGKE